MLNDQLVAVDARTMADPHRVTGVGMVTYLLTKYLDEQGIGVELLFDEKPNVQFKHHRTTVLASRSRPIWEQWLLPKFLIEKKINLFHATWNYGLPWYGYRGKTIVTVHDLIPLETAPQHKTLRDRLAFNYYRYATSHDIRSADQIITVSKTSELAVTSRYPGVQEKIHVVPNAVHPAYFTKPTGEFYSDRPYLLYVGGLDPRKNIELILNALTQVPEKVTLKITGTPNIYKDILDQRVHALGINTRVDFTGYVPTPELVELMRRAVAVVYPSRAEGFGIPIIEALAAGTPVIASNIPVFRELGGNYITLIDPHSAEDLSFAIKHVLNLAAADRRKLVTDGQVYAAGFSPDRMGENILKIYQEALK